MPPEALFVIGIVAIAAAFAYGLIRSRRRNPANDPIREEAVRQSYDEPDAYAKGGEQRLRDQAAPEK